MINLCMTLFHPCMMFHSDGDHHGVDDDDNDTDFGKCPVKTQRPFVKPGILIEEEVESDTKWTDLPLLEHGSLTALEIKAEELGDWIQRIRAR